MTLTRAGLAAFASLGLMAAAGTQAQAATITQWTFENQPVTGAPPYNNSPTPSTGAGTAIALGMDNTYGTPGQSFNSSDIVADPGSSDPTSQNAWRVRGQGAAGGAAANGWSTLAPQYTQGAEFDVSTLGFTGISVAFDFNPTNRGVEDLELQYNANTANAAGWTNAGLFSNTVAGGVWNDVAPVSLGAVGAVNNDASFGIRIVSAYHPGTTTYFDTNGTALNNNSGNVRYDNVTVIGTRNAAVPETSPLALLGLGLLPLGLLARRRKA